MGYEKYRRVTIDPRQKIMECAFAVQTTSDSNIREMLSRVQRLWMGLKDSELSDVDLAHEVAVVERVHVRLMRVVEGGTDTAVEQPAVDLRSRNGYLKLTG